MLRVLVAESNVTDRALLVETLRSDPQIEVVAEARNGAEAVELTKRLQPGLVVIGLQIKNPDGLETTKEIMIEQPTPIVLVASGEGQDRSILALRAGALGVIAAPPQGDSPAAQLARRNFLAMISAMSQVKLVRRSRRVADADRRADPLPPAHDSPVQIVAIAASTGGPAALDAILANLPAGFPAPILIVQHIASSFIEGVAAWLNRATPLKVKVAEDGERLEAGVVYLAPDDHHLGVSNRSRIRLVNEPPIGGFRPSATYLFESVAQAFGVGALAVILTGMGQDGVEGLRTVRKRGGRVIAQDAATSVVFGMPAATIEAGLATEVLPIGEIAGALVALLQNRK